MIEQGNKIFFSKLSKVEFFLKQTNISSSKRIFHQGIFLESVFYILKKSRRRFRQEEKTKINYNADSVLRYRTNDNLYSTYLENYRYDNIIIILTDEIKNDKKNLREINDDFKKENPLIDAGVEEEEEKKIKKKKLKKLILRIKMIMRVEDLLMN
ncbi:myb-like protein X [Vespula maculifrons]|uniref:Myb-like protein X n=1 Tax=Vespula maculifrons TaxID=7453 RepID=A0ABD2CGU0_VESMC